jgi:hypothetical protein
MTTESNNGTQELAVLLDLSQTEKDLIAAEAKHTGVVYDVKEPKQMKSAKIARSELKSMRTTAESKRLEAGRVLLGMKKKNDEFAQGLIARIRAMEDPIDAMISAEEDRVAAEKAAKALAEQERQDNHRAAIQRFRDFPLSLQGKPAEVMQSKMDAFMPALDWAEYDEFADQARDAYYAALGSAREILQRQRDYEAAQEQARIDRMRVEEQERELQALRDREAVREKEREAGFDLAIRHIWARSEALWKLDVAELEQLLTYHETQNPSNERDKYGDRYEEAVIAHKEVCGDIESFIADRKEKARVAEEVKQNLLRAEQAMAEQRRQQEVEAERQRIENERLQRERAEHAKEVERRRIANLGLMEAVRAVVDFYRGTREKSADQCVLDLISVYDALPT